MQSTVDSLHFEFHGVGQYEYELRKNGNTYRLEIPKQKNELVQKIVGTQHAILSKLVLEEPQPENRSVFLITPKNASIELFDYLTDDPPRLIVDLLPPEGSPQVASQGKNSRKQNPEVADTSKENLSGVKKMSPANPALKIDNSPKSRLMVQEKTDASKTLDADSRSSARKPASDILILPTQEQSPEIAAQLKLQSGIFDGADPDFKRFDLPDHEIKEEAKIRSQREFYIDFPMLRPENTILYELLARKPNLVISPEDSEENKQARLLVTLYENKRRNVFNTSIEWFFQKYPGSTYEAGLRFMWADNLFQMWKETRNPEMFDLAMLRYRQAIEVTKNQEAIEWALLLMGFATLDRGDIVGTLRQFEYHLRTRPQSPDRDVARLALAEAFGRLNQFEPALNAYEEVEKNGLTDSSRQMASFTKPDVFFQRKDYAKSIELYEAAIQKYPSAAKNYPNAYFNRAAAYFGQRKFKESLRAHLDFLKMFPSHPFAGYAMTRVGELLEALGASQNQVSGAYLETFFRYGQSPSALVARLRLFSARMHEMKSKEIERSMSELEAVAEKSDLPKIQQFKSFMISEGFARRKDYPKAIDELVRFYQKNPTQSDANLIQDRLIDHINAQLANHVDNGNFLDAFRWHEKYATTWLKNSDRIDTQFNLARSFELAGVPEASHQLYQTVLNRLLSLQGTAEIKERGVFEKLPRLESLHLRLAQTESSRGRWVEAYDQLREIKKPVEMSETEQIERVQLMASLLEKKNDLVPASRYLAELIQAWKGVPVLVAEPYLQLGQLESKQKKWPEAEASLKEIDALMKESGKVAVDTHRKSLELLYQAQLQQNKKSDAIQTIERLLNLYEAQVPMESIRYRLGQLHFEQGRVQKASEAWSSLGSKGANLWSRLAQEQLNNSNWGEENKRYIQRIPAMAERGNP